jgi:tRNA(His) 5'-end guanylyltransferase
MDEMKVQIDVRTICPEGTSEKIREKVANVIAEQLWEELFTDDELQSVKEDGKIVSKIDDDLENVVTVRRVNVDLHRIETAMPWEMVLEELNNDEEAIN